MSPVNGTPNSVGSLLQPLSFDAFKLVRVVGPTEGSWFLLDEIVDIVGHKAVGIVLPSLEHYEKAQCIIDGVFRVIVSRPAVLKFCSAAPPGKEYALAKRLDYFMRHEVMESVFNTGGYQVPGMSAPRPGLIGMAEMFLAHAKEIEATKAELAQVQQQQQSISNRQDAFERFVTNRQGRHNLVPWAEGFGIYLRPEGFPSQSKEGLNCKQIGLSMGYKEAKIDHPRYPLKPDGTGGVHTWPIEVLLKWLEDFVQRNPQYRQIVDQSLRKAEENCLIPRRRPQ